MASTSFRIVCGAASVVLFAVWSAVSTGAGSTSARAQTVPSEQADQRIAVVSETGQWRTRVQLVFDARTRALSRKTYTVWDALPSRNLEFTWTPAAPGTDAGPELVNGLGQLTWREKSKPSYDPSAVYSEYDGRLLGGKADGTGSLLLRDGIFYRGQWKDGRIEGTGLLRFSDGAEYSGAFHDGVANGTGTFIDTDGEVYAGPFKDGLREGQAETTLPNSFKYRSLWTKGREVEASRRVRLAQSGDGAQLPYEDVRIGITVDRAPGTVENNLGYTGRLGYTQSSSVAGLAIKPDSKRLLALWKGSGEIQLTEHEESSGDNGSFGVFAYTPRDLLPLNITMQFQNRSARNIQIVSVFLDVAVSTTDRQPAIQLSVGDDGECSSRQRANFSPRLQFQNYGWSAATAPQVSLGLGDSNPPAIHRLPPLSSVDILDATPQLSAHGIDAATLSAHAKQTFPCSGMKYAVCLDRLKGTGLFGRPANKLALSENTVRLPVHGSLDYDWTDDKGVLIHRSSPFSTNLALARFQAAAECGEGGEDQIVSHKAFELKLDRSRYKVPLAFEGQVPPGRQGRYLLALHAAKSSHHRFTVVVQLADGREIRSRAIDLTYFVPNWKPPA